MENKTNQARMIFDNCLVKDEKIFFVARNMNLICSYDMKEKRTEIMGRIPEENFSGERLAIKMHIFQDKIIFAPCSAKKIWICDLQFKEWHSVELRQYDAKHMGNKIYQTITYKERLYMIGNDYPAIVCMNMDTEELEYIEAYEHLLDGFNKKRESFFRSDYACVENSFYMASCVTNQVLKFDMEKNEYTWIKVGGNDNRYSGIAWDGESFWLAPRGNTPIVKWDGDKNYEEIKLPDRYNDNTFNFLGVTYFEDYIIIPGLHTNKSIYLHKNHISNIKIVDGQYTFLRALDDHRLLGQKNSGQLFITDKMNQTEYFEILLSSKQIKEFFHTSNYSAMEFLSEKLHNENSLFNLEELTMAIQDKKSTSAEHMDIGTDIWNTLIKM